MAEMQPTLDAIRALLTWPENWNRYTAMQPNPQAVAHAEQWIQQLYTRITQAGLAWIAPMVTASPSTGDVVCWWAERAGRKVELFIDADGNVRCSQVWEDDGTWKMSAPDEALSWEQAVAVWAWFVGQEWERVR